MLEQEPAVDEVVLGRALPSIDVAGFEGDVAQPAFSGSLPGHLQLGLVHVDADRRAIGPG